MGRNRGDLGLTEDMKRQKVVSAAIGGGRAGTADERDQQYEPYRCPGPAPDDDDL